MSYNPATDFVGLWRTVTGGVAKGEIPGLDFVVSALGRAGLITVSVSGTQPVANQATTAWFQPASPSYSAEGALYLWNATASAYQAATPALFRQFLEVSWGAAGTSTFTGTGAPSNALGNNGDIYIRTDSPGGVYGPKAAGAWPVTPLPGTGYSNTTNAFDYAFGSTQGSIIYRGAGTWQALAPGSAGQTLTTQGPGANPTWTNLSNTVNSAALDASFGSTTGNMLYRAPGGWQSLAISGTANSVLTNAGGIPTWTAISGVVDAAFGSTRGSVLYRGASGWTALAPGTSGYLLSTQGAGADPVWASPGVASVTSAAMDSAFGSVVGGVLIRGTGGWANLGVGSAGYVLTAHGAGVNPSWAAQSVPAAPGAGAVGSYALGNGTVGFDSGGSPYAGTWTVVSQLTASVYAGGAGGGGAGFSSIYLMQRIA